MYGIHTHLFPTTRGHSSGESTASVLGRICTRRLAVGSAPASRGAAESAMHTASLLADALATSLGQPAPVGPHPLHVGVTLDDLDLGALARSPEDLLESLRAAKARYGAPAAAAIERS